MKYLQLNFNIFSIKYWVSHCLNCDTGQIRLDNSVFNILFLSINSKSHSFTETLEFEMLRVAPVNYMSSNVY